MRYEPKVCLTQKSKRERKKLVEKTILKMSGTKPNQNWSLTCITLNIYILEDALQNALKKGK